MGERICKRRRGGQTPVMAIVKANFVKRGKSAKGRAKASIRYIQHRRGKDGEAITRTLFGSDGEMPRADAYRMIDEARKGSLFYRFVLSPDPKAEDTGRDLDMRGITIQTLQALESVSRSLSYGWQPSTLTMFLTGTFTSSPSSPNASLSATLNFSDTGQRKP